MALVAATLCTAVVVLVVVADIDGLTKESLADLSFNSSRNFV